jgi:hypothetical protein
MTYRLSVTIAVALVGCASFPPGVPTAMIRYTSNMPTLFVPFCSRDDFLLQGVVNVDGVKEVSPVKMYGTRSDKNGVVSERLIPADRTLLLRGRWGHAVFTPTIEGSKGTQLALKGQLTQCDVLFTLAPQPNEQYQAHYTLSEGACAVKVYRLTQTNGVIGKVELPNSTKPDAKETFEVCGPKGKRFIP